MTEEMEKWVDEITIGTDADRWHAMSRMSAHFWISAFVRLVREEAKEMKHHSKADISITESVGWTFERLIQRFGLEGK